MAVSDPLPGRSEELDRHVPDARPRPNLAAQRDACPDTGEGNPPSLIRLADGRLCLTYGYRAVPFGIRARLSGDGGKTWNQEIVLRDDGGGRDVGYPRSVQRPDGKVVTVYYFHDTLKGERYIAATIWGPG
jgi:hypothetical protein